MIDTYNIQLAIYFVLTVISLVFHFYVTIRMRNFVIAQEKALGFQVLYLRHTNNILLFNGFLTIANLLLALLVIIIGNSPNSKFLVAIVIGTNLVSEFLVFYILIMRKQSKYSSQGKSMGSLPSTEAGTTKHSLAGSSIRGTAETSSLPPSVEGESGSDEGGSSSGESEVKIDIQSS
eukprot:TRINITY_DN310_c0_g1_i5.p2 TRINITY_DN310_c0_g1~~TRINITY_DN310_c0_g1_i5.p2  ORF type:complete len:177 (+),score=34.10 TRINITY_DN310_c0_g1_i5:1028-1558(+)